MRGKKIKVPTVLQMEASECGAASLTMILRYYGKYVPLEQVRVECGVSRDGSKASNILKAARHYGMEAKGYNKEPAKLVDMHLPLVIHWNFSHFLVLEGMGKNKYHLNDPVSGRRSVTEEEFNQSFTGIVLSFIPEADFKKEGQKNKVSKVIINRLSGLKGALTYVVLLGLALVITGIILPVFSRIFIDDVFLGGNSSWIFGLLFGMGMTAVFRGVLTWMQKYILLKIETKIAVSSSSSFLWHILNLPAVFFSQRASGDIATRMQSNDKVAKFISSRLTSTVINLLMVIFYFFLMLRYNTVLAVMGFLIASVNIMYLKFVSSHRKDSNNRLLKDRGLLLATSMNGLQIIETIKAGGSESDFFAKWSGYQTKALNAEQELGLSSNYLNALAVLLTGINNGVVLTAGALFILQGNMTIGMLVAFQSLMESFMTPVKEIVGLGTELQEIEGEIERLEDVMSHPTDFENINEMKSEDEENYKLEGFVEFRNITFGYSSLEAPLIENFSLKLRPGSRVALVGGSGSGKSTIAKLLAGVYQPWSGEILFDGRPRSQWPKSVIANSLSMVDQEIRIFRDSIRDNITLWDETVTEAELTRGAKDACIHDDITVRTGGYDQSMAEGGKNFSGGQRQRIEIARALVQNPSILVLDEATSALDPLMEKIVDDNIRRRGCTCMIVAHRLSTIRDCDEIILLSKGKILERGTHDELYAKNGNYTGLIKTV